MASGNVDTYGIVVGSGGDAVSVSDYKLQSQILHGDTAGKLYHTVGKVCSQTLGDSSRKWLECIRSFINMTEHEVVVREVGAYARDQSALTFYCIVRDAVGSIIVPPLGGIIVNYTFELSL
jgi:hypothetical protein